MVFDLLSDGFGEVVCVAVGRADTEDRVGLVFRAVDNHPAGC